MKIGTAVSCTVYHHMLQGIVKNIKIYHRGVMYIFVLSSIADGAQ
jgi:hypothetical protein